MSELVAELVCPECLRPDCPNAGAKRVPGAERGSGYSRVYYDEMSHFADAALYGWMAGGGKNEWDRLLGGDWFVGASMPGKAQPERVSHVGGAVVDGVLYTVRSGWPQR